MENKTNVWKIVGIIAIVVAGLLFLSNLGLQEEIDEWVELTEEWSDLYDDAVFEWCIYSNDLIEYSNSLSYYDTNLNLNDCEW